MDVLASKSDSGESAEENQLCSSVETRVQKISAALKKEDWLPFSFRGLLAMELPKLLGLVHRHGRSWKRQVAKQAFALALLSLDYVPDGRESETVSHLRVLDLEMNEAAIQAGANIAAAKGEAVAEKRLSV